MNESSAREGLSAYYRPVEMPGGYRHDVSATLRKVELYYNSQFESGPRDSLGRRKFFYNVVRPACDVATKYVDLDTKDVVLYSRTPGADFRVWLMQRELRSWMSENGFAELLNRISADLPKYGHFVAKLVRGKLEPVYVANLRLDPSVREMSESPFVYELRRMSGEEMRAMPGWDVPEDMGDSVVYECYDRDRDGWKRTFRADFLRFSTPDGKSGRTPESQINLTLNYLPGKTLYEDRVPSLPYRELKWEDVPGRWLGMGTVEYLFDNQVRANELANVKARGLELLSMHVFQTSDESVGRNVLEFENGDVIQSATGVSEVVMAERNLASFAQEEARWDANSERKTFTSDIARGGDLPSSTPLGVAKLSAAMVESYFGMKREKMGLYVKRLIVDDVMPSFRKSSSRKHSMRFFSSDKDIQRLRDAVVAWKSSRAIAEYAVRTGTIPSAREIAMERTRLEGAMRRRKDVALEVPQGMYDGTDVGIDVTVTGEDIDVGARIQTLQVLLTTVATNPGVATDPATRPILMRMMEYSGISPEELDMGPAGRPPQAAPTGSPPAAPGSNSSQTAAPPSMTV